VVAEVRAPLKIAGVFIKNEKAAICRPSFVVFTGLSGRGVANRARTAGKNQREQSSDEKAAKNREKKPGPKTGFFQRKTITS
jgi:hypothetical protein